MDNLIRFQRRKSLKSRAPSAFCSSKRVLRRLQNRTHALAWAPSLVQRMSPRCRIRQLWGKQLDHRRTILGPLSHLILPENLPMDSKPHPNPGTAVDTEDPHHPSTQPFQRKYQLYRTLTLVWWFPTGGSILILAISLKQGSLAPLLASPRLEHLTAIGLLLCHLSWWLRARRFRQLNENRIDAKFDP